MKSTVTRDTDLNEVPSSQHEEVGEFYKDMIVLHASRSQEYMNLSLHFFDKTCITSVYYYATGH